MKKGNVGILIVVAVLLCTIPVAFASEGAGDTGTEEGAVSSVPVVMRFMGEDGNAVTEAGVLAQKDTGEQTVVLQPFGTTDEAVYSGRTDGNGEVVFMEFPITTFWLSIANDEGAAAHTVKLLLQEAVKTELVNPQAQATDPTASGQGWPIYEANVNKDAKGVEFVFQMQKDSSFVLQSVAELSATPSPAPSETPTAEATETPTEQPTSEPTATPTPSPTETPTEQPTATATPSPEVADTVQPSATSQPEGGNVNTVLIVALVVAVAVVAILAVLLNRRGKRPRD